MFYIAGTGSALPKKVVSNDDLAEFLDTSDEWIQTRTGIKRRHVLTDERLNDLAILSAQRALEDAGVEGKDVDLILCATMRADTYPPSLACRGGVAIGSHAPAFDLNAACVGVLYCMEVADAFISSGKAETVLIVSAEAMSKLLDWTDRSTCVLFGDGAAAAVVRLADVPYACILGGRGEAAGLHANSLLPGQNRYLFMDGRAIFRFAVDIIPKCLNQLFEKSGTSLEQVDHVVCHQANSRIIDHVVKKLGAPEDKFYKNMHRYGNTSAASIPLALDEMLESGAIRPGQTVACVGFGAGLTWGAVLLRF